MALIIKNNPDAVPYVEVMMITDEDGLPTPGIERVYPLDPSIRIQGTDILPESLYVRLHMIGDACGTRLGYNAQMYLNKDKYAQNDPVSTTVGPTSAFGTVTEQSVITLHEVAKAEFEKYGYSVTIEI